MESCEVMVPKDRAGVGICEAFGATKIKSCVFIAVAKRVGSYFLKNILFFN